MYTVDIDTGGTMTDGLVAEGPVIHAIKVDTTPHDLTVSFREVLVEAARRLGHGEDLRSFLDQVALIRWSSTITSNVLGEGRGSKVGLLVRAGHEEDLYGPGRSPAVGRVVAGHNVLGLADDPDDQAVLNAVKQLFGDGVRRVCVSFDDAFPDNAGERAVRRVIESQYPDHYLGAVPVLLGSEMAQVDDAATRTHCSLINAYVHSHLAASLFKAEDLLKYDEGWDGPLLVGHINGGVARVAKTKAVDTIESGPVFGTFASAYLARRYGLGDVACLDVGGTTAKASVVRGGEPLLTREADLFGIPVRLPLALLQAVALGGGSVARLEDNKSVRLGPDSMGAAPGPACYGLGGTEATLTDAFVVLGYLDPTRFLDGRRPLDVERARDAIGRKLAEPLGMSVEEAAAIVAGAAVDVVADLGGSTLEQAGLRPEEVTLFAYGGNGGLFAAPVAERLGISTAYVFALGPVFSALGSSVSDVVHIYERSVGRNPEELRATVEALAATARRDLAAEGFDVEAASMEVEFDLGNGATTTVRGDDIRTLYEGVTEAPAGSGTVKVVRLKTRFPVGAYEPGPRPRADAGSAPPQPVEERALPVYDWDSLVPGSALSGPAIAAGGTLTCLVPAGWSLGVDELGNGVLRG